MIFQDFRYAARMLRKSPGFTLVAVATLALGIGANTAIYGWLRRVLLAPVPGAAEPGSLVAVETLTPAGTRIDSGWADYTDLRESTRSFDGIVAFQTRHVTLSGKEHSHRVYALFVSGNYFDVMGVAPSVGRGFLPSEGTPPAAVPVAVISDGFWERRFARAGNIIGQTIRLNGRAFTIAGVAPPEFKGSVNGLNFDVYVPLAATRLLGGELSGGRGDLVGNRTTRWLAMMGRLRRGVSLDAANAELATIAARLARAYPDSNRGMGFVAEPVRDATYGISGRLGGIVVALFAAVGLVLLIGCVNVANLLLARASTRRREIAVRLALGASRSRLVRQLLSESLLLSLLGGVAGLLMVPWINGLLESLLPLTPAPLDLMPTLDAPIFLFGFLLSLASGTIFGLVPALQASRPAVAEDLKESGSALSSGSRPRLRRALVVSEIALALLLSVTTGLFLKSLTRAQTMDPGFDKSNVLLFGFDIPGPLNGSRAIPMYEELLRRVRRIPGVASASYGNHVPLGLEGGDWEETSVDGYVPAPNENMKIYVDDLWPGYFQTLRIPVLAGRDFTEGDREGTQPVAIVNAAFARRFLAGGVVGATIRMGGDPIRVVGLVPTIKYRSLSESPLPLVYLPHLQAAPAGTALFVRLSPSAARAPIADRVRSEAESLSPGVATISLGFPEATEGAIMPQKLGARLLGALGALALLLSAIGIYGLTSYSVTRRTREIGIRIALGARRSHVLAEIVGEGMRLAFVGVGLGLAGAVAATRLLRGLLLGESPTDPLVLGLVAAILVVTAFAANFIPAFRAANVDPMTALREE